MYQNIKSYEDACAVKGVDPIASLPIVTGVPEDLREYIINTYKLAIVNQAINGTWRADYGNHRQRKHYPWFWVEEDHIPGSAGGFSFDGCRYAYTDSNVGARLVYETEEKAEYAGNQFLDLYEKVHLIPNQ